MARSLLAARRGGRDARAPGPATTGRAETNRVGPLAPLAEAGSLVSFQPAWDHPALASGAG